MKNFIQNGASITMPAPAGGVTSGDGVIIGSIFGVSSSTAAEGEAVSIATVGVYALPKAISTSFASGGAVSFDISTRRCVGPGSGKYPIGAAIEAAGNGASAVKVRLNGVSIAPA